MAGDLETLSFEEWWKDVRGKPPTKVTVEDVIDVAFPGAQIIDQLDQPPDPMIIVKWLVLVAKSTVILEDKNISLLQLELDPQGVALPIGSTTPAPVDRLEAVVSMKARTAVLHAWVGGPSATDTMYTYDFWPSFDVFLTAIKYPLKGADDVPSIAALFSAIVGPIEARSYMENIPAQLCGTVKLPTQPLDPKKSIILFTSSPFGPYVTSASLVSKIPEPSPSVDLIALKVALKGVTLSLTRNGNSYNISQKVQLELDVGSGSKWDIDGQLSSAQNCFAIECKITTETTLAQLLQGLGSDHSSDLAVPLDGSAVDKGEKLGAGFTLVQHYPGIHTPFSLEEIFFELPVGKWKTAPWDQVLPPSLHPKSYPRITILAKIFQPLSKARALGLQVTYLRNIKEGCADLKLQFSHFPLKASNNADAKPIYITSLSASLEDTSLPAPNIDEVLASLTDSTWDKIKNALPLLEKAAKVVTIRDLSFEITAGKKISSFGLSATISNLTVLPDLLVIEKADIALSHTLNQWNGSLRTQLRFAKEYHCRVDFQLPTKDVAGSLAFVNQDPAFTLEKLVHAIDKSIALKDIPVLGETIADFRLDHFYLSILGSPVSVTGFEVEVDWEKLALGNVQSSNNRLVVAWTAGRKPASGSPAIPAAWAVHIEGYLGALNQLSPSLAISADLQVIPVPKSKTEPKEFVRQVVLSGTVLNIVGRTEAGHLVNTLTAPLEATHDPTTIGVVPVEKSAVWESGVPTRSTKGFSLDRVIAQAQLGDPNLYAFAAQASWGKKGTGAAALRLQKGSKDSAWSFILGISVKDFTFSDLWNAQDGDFAQGVDSHLTISNAEVLAFKQSEEVHLSAVCQDVADLSPGHFGPSSGISQLSDAAKEKKVRAGIAIVANLSVGTSKPESLTHKLAVTSNSKLPTDIQLICYISRESDNKAGTTSSHIEFTAKVSEIKLFDSVTFHNITLMFKASKQTTAKDKSPTTPSTPSTQPVNSGQPPPGQSHSEYSLSLKGECDIHFSREHPWSLSGDLNVDEQKAHLLVTTKSPQHLLELGNLSFDNIKFDVTYIFGVQPKDSKPLDQNKGTVKYGGISATFSAQLSAQVKFGSLASTKVGVLFKPNSCTPQTILIDLPEIEVGKVFQAVLGDGFPSDLLNISFKDLKLWYSWAPKESSNKYKSGFHGEANVDVFGIKFWLDIGIMTGDSQTRGIIASAKPEHPIELLLVELYDPEFVPGSKDPKRGPIFFFSTLKNTSGQKEGTGIHAGFSILGHDAGKFKFAYTLSKKDNTPCLAATVTLNLDIFPNGHVDIPFEVVEVDKKTHIRFSEIPTEHKNPIDADTIKKAISKITEKDICGAIDLVFKAAITTKFTCKLSLADKQPAKVEGKPQQVKFNIDGDWEIVCLGERVEHIKFDRLPLEIDVPKDWKTLGDGIVDQLKKSVELIMQALVINKAQLTEVLLIVSAEKAASTLFKRALCRQKNKKLEEKPRTNEPKDEGGETGNGDGGSGGIWKFIGLVEFIFAVMVAEAFGPELLALLAAVLLIKFLMEQKEPPKRPKEAEKPLPDLEYPGPTDYFGKLVHAALNKKFDRWKLCTDFPSALENAYECGKDYRTAIEVLRWIIRDGYETVGAQKAALYETRLKVLIYQFSMLTFDFADKWMKLPPGVTATATASELIVNWPEGFHGRALAISAGKSNWVIPPAYKKNSIHLKWSTPLSPQDSGVDRLTVKIVPFILRKGDDRKDDFFSKGKVVSVVAHETAVVRGSLHANHAYALRNKASETLCDLLDGKGHNGAPVGGRLDQSSSSTAFHQHWIILPAGDHPDTYRLRSVSVGTFLDLGTNTELKSVGVNIDPNQSMRTIAFKSSTSNTQQWVLTAADSEAVGYSRIKNVASGRYLEVAGGSRVDGAVIQAADRIEHNDAQLWEILRGSSGQDEVLHLLTTKLCAKPATAHSYLSGGIYLFLPSTTINEIWGQIGMAQLRESKLESSDLAFLLKSGVAKWVKDNVRAEGIAVLFGVGYARVTGEQRAFNVYLTSELNLALCDPRTGKQQDGAGIDIQVVGY